MIIIKVWVVVVQRKVIQIAESTQLISLPRKWAVKHNIKKGDDAMSLTFEQQSTLFLYDKLARKGADLGMVLNKPKGPQRDKALKSLWLNYHWANAAKQPELVPVREKQWDESMKTFDLAKAKELVKK